jgi:hypothetical protein
MKILNAIFNLIASANPSVRSLIWFAALIVAFLDYMTEMWGEMFSRIDALLLQSLPESVDFQPLGVINYIFPLDTFFTTMAALFALYAVCVLVRIIKSVIPLIS